MNEEIKEILDYFKTFQKTNIEQIWLNQKRAKQLLDYITNLQTIEQQYSPLLSENAELENKIIELQEENKRLQFAVKDTKENADEIICELKEENEHIKVNNKETLDSFDETMKDIKKGLIARINRQECEIERLKQENERLNINYKDAIEDNDRLHKSLEEQRHFYLGEIQRYEHYCKTTGIDELMGENERLKGEKEQLNSLVNSCQERIRKQNNIIKEAREYINSHKQKTIDSYEDEVEDYEIELWEYEINDILEILDKGDEKND